MNNYSSIQPYVTSCYSKTHAKGLKCLSLTLLVHLTLLHVAEKSFVSVYLWLVFLVFSLSDMNINYFFKTLQIMLQVDTILWEYKWAKSLTFPYYFDTVFKWGDKPCYIQYKLKFFVSNVVLSTCICMHTMKKQKVNSLEYHVD